MEQLIPNLPWLIIWVVVILLQSWFLRKKNYFASLLTLWVTLLVSIFWDGALEKLVPGIDGMWLFGTKIWVLCFIVAIRHFLSQRKPARPPQPAAGGAEEEETQEQTSEPAPEDPSPEAEKKP
ncbi:MAG TPA: hypothetical protein H9844_01350 [Candidatus Evtepia faecigallinarum]|nr:hypothetical protein [Candidatus Evtepia faecigallinarum]